MVLADDVYDFIDSASFIFDGQWYILVEQDARHSIIDIRGDLMMPYGDYDSYEELIETFKGYMSKKDEYTKLQK